MSEQDRARARLRALAPLAQIVLREETGKWRLISATHLGLVDVGSHRLHASPWPRRNPCLNHVHITPVRPADRAAIEDYLRHYRPGGPMGPMRESPYRDWPPR